jgi:flavodoxin I
MIINININGGFRMKKIIMVYASMSGNTEEIANIIAEGINEQEIDLQVKEVMDVTASELEKYDGIILGSYTWGDGELADEFLDFYDDMDSLNLTGKKAAAFGSGDHAYEHFCAAVDILEEKLVQMGAELVQEGLKIEMSPSDKEKEVCREFGRNFIDSLIPVK